MSKTVEFKVFCLESYKNAYQLDGFTVLKLFKKNKVFDYISSFYDVLHSTGQQYIVNDIDLYIKARQSTKE
jgi:uncharacterized protein DUF3791